MAKKNSVDSAAQDSTDSTATASAPAQGTKGRQGKKVGPGGARKPIPVSFTEQDTARLDAAVNALRSKDQYSAVTRSSLIERVTMREVASILANASA